MQDSGDGEVRVEQQDALPAQSTQLGSLPVGFKTSERRKKAVTVGVVVLVLVIVLGAVGSISYALTRAKKSTQETVAVSETPTMTTTPRSTMSLGILSCDPLGVWNSVTARTTATSCLVARAAAREIKEPAEGAYSFEDPMTGESITVTCQFVQGSKNGLSCRGASRISFSLKDPTRTPTQEDNYPLFTTVLNVFTRRSETSTTSSTTPTSTAEPSVSRTTRVEGTSSRNRETTSSWEPTSSDMADMSSVDSDTPMASFIPSETEPSVVSSSSSSGYVYEEPGQESYDNQVS